MGPSSVEDRPDLVVGLVGPVGVDHDVVIDALRESFRSVSYQLEQIRISALIDDAANLLGLDDGGATERYDRLMRLGTELRRTAGEGAIAAMLSVVAVVEVKRHLEGEARRPTAFVLRQLKHDEEIELLRRIYGSRFILVAATANRAERIERIVHFLGNDQVPRDQRRARAEALIARDEAEHSERLGQQVRRVFPLADAFVDVSREPILEVLSIREQVGRTVQLLFGFPFHTPTRDELGSYHAHAASLRSSALGRQVGCAITDRDGDILATGANEVAKYGGGQYWAEDRGDARDFRQRQEISDFMNRQLLEEILIQLREANVLREEIQQLELPEYSEYMLNRDGPLSSSSVLDLLEFGRVVHAEMSAIMSCARRGTSAAGGTLYTTTFPCHECARHIVAAGIERLVYREPYPKSRVNELYPDSIAVDEDARERVLFVPFVGIAPRMFTTVFTADERKTESGRIMDWDPTTASPRLSEVDTEGLGLVEARELTVVEGVRGWLSDGGPAASDQ